MPPPELPWLPEWILLHKALRCGHDLLEQARPHVVDEPRNGDVIGDERRPLDPANVLPDAFLEVGERQEVNAGCISPCVGLELSLEFLVREGEHPAVGV